MPIWLLAVMFYAPDSWPCLIRAAGEARGLFALLWNLLTLVRSAASDLYFRASVPGLANERVNGAPLASCEVGRHCRSDYCFRPCDGSIGLAGIASPFKSTA